MQEIKLKANKWDPQDLKKQVHNSNNALHVQKGEGEDDFFRENKYSV